MLFFAHFISENNHDCDTGHINRNNVLSTGCEITQSVELPHSVAGAALVIMVEQL